MTANELAAYVSSGFEKAKRGEARKLYESILPYLEAGSLPAQSHYPFGWIVYYAIHQAEDSEIGERKRMLAAYLRLKVAVPHKLHSMILTEAIRLYKDATKAGFGKRREERVEFSILKFLALWDLANLRPGDWNRKTIDDKPLSATVEKLLTVVVDECESARVRPEDAVIKLADKAVCVFPDSFSAFAQRAALCELTGDIADAREWLRKALLLAPGKFFLWSRLGALVAVTENPNLHIALLQRALKSPGPEQMKGRVRLSLARALAALQAYGYAMWELMQVKRIYETNGWHLPAGFQSLSKRMPENTVPADPGDIYKKTDRLADEYLYSDLPETQMVKTYHKKPSGQKHPRYGQHLTAWRITDEQGTNVWFTPEKSGIDANLPLGTRLNVKLFNGRVVGARLAEE